MDTYATDVALKENIAQVMQTLPPFIRTYIEQQKYTTVARGLMSKYKLRIDQGGILELNLLLLLMGIIDPTEFMNALTEKGGLDKEAVSSLSRDINEQVFLPLRKQEEAQTKQVSPFAAKPATTPAPKPVVPTPPHIAPLPPKMAMPKSGSLGDIVRRITAPTAPNASRLLEDHEEPHIELKKGRSPIPVAPVTTVAPAQKPTPAPEQRMQPTPMPKPALPEPAMRVTPPTPPIPHVLKTPPPPPAASYEVDPYREPLDDK